eukprot:3714034-Pleurochrysis_carterae.AAC.2
MLETSSASCKDNQRSQKGECKISGRGEMKEKGEEERKTKESMHLCEIVKEGETCSDKEHQ